MMTRKDYVAIANIIREYMVNHGDRDMTTIAVRGIARELAGYFGQGNPSFDRARFLMACGVAP